jgi:hypothetical protein
LSKPATTEEQPENHFSEVSNVKDNVDLRNLVDEALAKVVNGSEEITKKELSANEEKYEIQLAEEDEDTQTRLVLKKKGNGRPVPVVAVNAVSDGGENIFYSDQRIDSPAKVRTNVEDAMEALMKELKATS